MLCPAVLPEPLQLVRVFVKEVLVVITYVPFSAVCAPADVIKSRLMSGVSIAARTLTVAQADCIPEWGRQRSGDDQEVIAN